MADQDEPDDEDRPDDDTDPDPGSEGPAPKSPARSASAPAPKTASSRAAGGLRVSDGSGLILGLLVWGWVIVPYLKGGKAGVKNVLTAKFFNKKDGSPLL